MKAVTLLIALLYGVVAHASASKYRVCLKDELIHPFDFSRGFIGLVHKYKHLHVYANLTIQNAPVPNSTNILVAVLGSPHVKVANLADGLRLTKSRQQAIARSLYSHDEVINGDPYKSCINISVLPSKPANYRKMVNSTNRVRLTNELKLNEKIARRAFIIYKRESLNQNRPLHQQSSGSAH